MQRSFAPLTARGTALGLAAALTFAILHSLGGIADRQVDGAVLALRAQACTAVAADTHAAARQPV